MPARKKMSARRRGTSSETRKEEEAKIIEFVSSGTITNTSGDAPWANSQEVLIDLDKILLPDFQLRVFYDRQKIDQIKATIEAFGIKEPLLLRPHPIQGDDGYYELIAGSQRRLSAEELGLKQVPAKVDDVDDLTALKIGLIENEARSDFNPFEKARGVIKILGQGLNISDDEVCQCLRHLYNSETRHADSQVSELDRDLILEVFDELGINWKSFVANQLPLLSLPEDIVAVLETGDLSYTKAVAISRVKDENQRQDILDQAISEQLTLSQIKELIQQSKPKKSGDGSADKQLRDRVRSTIARATKPAMLKDPKIRRKVKSMTEQLEKLLDQQETE